MKSFVPEKRGGSSERFIRKDASNPWPFLTTLPLPQIDGAQALGSLLERGALCRATASTNMNAHSSRSHAICTLSFQTVRPATADKEETVTSSQFHIVDLAGSERVKKTGAEVGRSWVRSWGVLQVSSACVLINSRYGMIPGIRFLFSTS